MNRQQHPVDRRFVNEVHQGTASDIAKRVYDGELTVEEAAVKYDLNPSSVKGYLRLYRAETGLPPRTRTKKAGKVTQSIETPKDSSLKEYESMSKEELIDALVMARINEARLKKVTQ